MFVKVMKFCTKSSLVKNSCQNFISARRQPPNLLRSLSLSVKRDHSLTNNGTIGSFTKCNDKRCLTLSLVTMATKLNII